MNYHNLNTFLIIALFSFFHYKSFSQIEKNAISPKTSIEEINRIALKYDMKNELKLYPNLIYLTAYEVNEKLKEESFEKKN